MPETSTGLQHGGGTERHDLAARPNSHAPDPATDDHATALVSRVQLDETLAQVRDLVLTISADGRIGYVSPAVSDLLEFDQADLLGRPLTDFLHPDEHDSVMARLGRGHGHHDVGTRVLVLDAIDGYRDMLMFVHAGPALDAVGYRAVVLRDARDRGHTLDALRQRIAFEDLLTRVTSSFIHQPAHEIDAGITAALADIGTFVGVDRAYVFVTSDDGGAIENSHEWTADDIPAELPELGRIDRMTVPHWMATLEQLEPIYIPRVADQDESWRGEIALLKPHGARSVLAVPLADEGRLIGFVGFDLVERERIWSDDHISVLSSTAAIISQALARTDAEQRFVLAFENAPLGMVLSSPDGRLIQVNQAYCDLVGRTPDELIGSLTQDQVHPDDVDELARVHAEVVGGRTDQQTLDVRRVQGDGEVAWLRLHISGVRGGDGNVRYTVSHVEDITVRHRQELELRASEQRYRTVVESSPAIIVRFDAGRRVTYVSPAFESFTGIPVADALGLLAGDFPLAREGERWDHVLDRVFSSGERLDAEWEASMPDGTTLWFQSRAVPEFGDDGAIDHVLVMMTDITALKRTEAELAHQALHDPLTGLANRALLLDHLGRVLARRQRTPLRVGLLFLDLDRFKVINDSLGHAAGDQLLVAMADRLGGTLRPTDTVARLGGDEFVVLIEDFVDPRDPILLAERIQAVIKQPVVVDGNEVFTTVSIGIAVANDPADTAGGLLRDADAAMYLAKARGRDRFEIFDEELRLQATERLQTESHLRRAVEMGEIEVYYQPEVSLDTGVMVGAEALARWHHPVAGLLEAGAFIELAEDSGLILELGEWVLAEACRQAGVWRREHPDFPLTMRVNLSARQIAQPDLVDQVMLALHSGGIPASSLCLEITETALMSDPAAGLRVLVDLRSLGVELAIDDFGTGYSSLSYLKRFPVDVLKIDRSFVDGLGDDAEDTAIVTAIISLARALGLRVVAEGVETRRQLDELRRLGCDRGQGFLFARPRPAPLLWESRTPYPVSADPVAGG